MLDPNQGVLFVGGDTCQTINPGSAFSFAEVQKAFETVKAASVVARISKAKQRRMGKKAVAAAAAAAAEQVQEPNSKIFALGQNFRWGTSGWPDLCWPDWLLLA